MLYLKAPPTDVELREVFNVTLQERITWPQLRTSLRALLSA